MDLLWSRIYDVIIKSILCGEHYVQAATKKYNLHRNNCFEIFGYDIILDSELKPWLLEVNLSPSLACESPLDTTIKANLIADAFNMIGVKRFDRRKENMMKLKNRAKINGLGSQQLKVSQITVQSQQEMYLGGQLNPALSNLLSYLIQSGVIPSS